MTTYRINRWTPRGAIYQLEVSQGNRIFVAWSGTLDECTRLAKAYQELGAHPYDPGLADDIREFGTEEQKKILEQIESGN